MMLPIMAGFQMTISLTELELGNDQLLHNNFIGKAADRLEERAYLEGILTESAMAQGVPVPGKCIVLAGFALVPDDGPGNDSDKPCGYMHQKQFRGKIGRLITTKTRTTIDVCLVGGDSHRQKCSSEVSKP